MTGDLENLVLHLRNTEAALEDAEPDNHGEALMLGNVESSIQTLLQHLTNVGARR